MAKTIYRNRANTITFTLSDQTIDTGEAVGFKVGPVCYGGLSGSPYFTARSDAANSNGSQISIDSYGPPVQLTVEIGKDDAALIPATIIAGRIKEAGYEVFVEDAEVGDDPRTLEVGDINVIRTL